MCSLQDRLDLFLFLKAEIQVFFVKKKYHNWMVNKCTKKSSVRMTDVFGPFPPKSPGLEGHSSWREEAADKEAKRGSTNEDGAWWTGLILPQVMGETRDRGQCPCMPSQLISTPPPPPPSPLPPSTPISPPSRMTSGSPLQAGKGKGEE